MADERKAKSGTYSVKNIAPGVRGFYTFDGGYVELDPGQVATDAQFAESDYALADKSGYFEISTGELQADEPGQATETPAGAKAYKDITVTDLQKHLTDAGVEYESDANKKALYDQYLTTFGGTGEPEGATTPDAGDTLDKMSDDDLRDTVKALTGEEPAEGTDRETLLKLARGEE